MSKTFASLLLVTVLLMSACAKILVVPVKVPIGKDGKPGAVTIKDGLIYALPVTVVRVQLKVDKSQAQGAPYMAFAEIFAPDGKPVCDPPCTKDTKHKPSPVFSLQDAATFSTYGEPDPDNVYLVKFVGFGPIDQTMNMTWNDTGLVSGASSTVTNKTTDVIVSGLKLAASLGSKTGFGAFKAETGERYCSKEQSNTDTWALPIFEDIGGAAKNTLIENYCSIKNSDRGLILKDENLLAKAVIDFLNRVWPLMMSRDAILGNAWTVGEPAAMLDKLETLIDQQISELYLGSKKTQTWTGSVDVRLNKKAVDENQPISILRLDATKGICLDQSVLAPDSKLIPKDFQMSDCDEARKIAATIVSLNVNYYPDKSTQLFTKIQDDESGDRSFRYRMPAQVKVQLQYSDKGLGAGVLSVAQLGTVISLPANRHTKALTYDLGFIETTGGLRTFKLNSTGAVDTATIDALNNIGGTIADARNAARKADDPVTVFTREYTLLKLQDDICNIRKKYGLSCDFQPQ